MKVRFLALAIAALVVVAAAALYFLRPPAKPANVPLVTITQIATHPALDEVRAGLIAGLARRGYTSGKTVRILFRNANGDPSLTAPIAQDFARRAPAVIVPISTPSTLAVAQATKTVPIVFSGVTDPVGVGLLRNPVRPGGNITGVSDRWPFEQQVKTFRRLMPRVRRIGMIYTRGDDVSKIGVQAMQALSQELGFELILRPVSSAQDLYPTAQQLFARTDAVYTGIDHLVLENLDAVIKAGREADKPVFGGETGTVEKGGVLAVTINMTEFGDITADMVARVLGGSDPGDLPVRTVTRGELFVNRAAATHFGLNVEQLKASGARIYDPR